MRKKTLVYLAVVWTIIIVACTSSAITMAVCGINVFSPVSLGTSDEGEKSSDERYKRLEQVRRQLSDNFYLDVDDDKLIQGAIDGMTQAVGDPYTFYYTPEQMSSMNKHTQGRYEGVGLLLSLDKSGALTTVRVFKNSPAQTAGMLPGDIITSINGEDLTSAKATALTRATNAIQQSGEDEISVGVMRDGQALELSMKNAPVEINRVEHAVLGADVGYIAIYEFMGDDVKGFNEAVASLKESGVKKVVIDLRSNPGGLLDDVVSIADKLMPEGLIVYTLDRYKAREEYFSDGNYWDAQIAVLINAQSASASEILAGALQDSGRAVIIGEQSFGKGIVQTVVPFGDDGAGMQLTTAAYYTPSGRSIHSVGITPDIKVSRADNQAYSDFESDSQLQAAFKWLAEHGEKEG